MLKPHLSYIAAISVHRRTSGYPWRGGSVRSDFQCRLLYLKTYGGSREVAEDDRSLLNSWRWSLGRSKWGVKCSDPNSRISVFWTTLISNYYLEMKDKISAVKVMNLVKTSTSIHQTIVLVSSHLDNIIAPQRCGAAHLPGPLDAGSHGVNIFYPH